MDSQGAPTNIPNPFQMRLILEDVYRNGRARGVPYPHEGEGNEVHIKTGAGDMLPVSKE
jgi:hypothetical protein